MLNIDKMMLMFDTMVLLKVVATAVDFVKFVKTTTGGEDLIHQFMGEKQGEHK